MGNYYPTVGATSVALHNDSSIAIDGVASVSRRHGDVPTIGAAAEPARDTATSEADRSITCTPDAERGGANSFADTTGDWRAPGATVNATVTPRINPPTIEDGTMQEAKKETAASAETSPEAPGQGSASADLEGLEYDAISVAAGTAGRFELTRCLTARRYGAGRDRA